MYKWAGCLLCRTEWKIKQGLSTCKCGKMTVDRELNYFRVIGDPWDCIVAEKRIEWSEDE